MNKQGHEELKKVLQFSFLESRKSEENQPSLKQIQDLFAKFHNCQLEELISLDSNEINVALL